MSLEQPGRSGEPFLFSELEDPKGADLGPGPGWLLETLRSLAAKDGFAYPKEKWLAKRHRLLRHNASRQDQQRAMKNIRRWLDRLHLAGLLCWRKVRLWNNSHPQNVYRPLPEPSTGYSPPPISNPRIAELFKSSEPANQGTKLSPTKGTDLTRPGDKNVPNQGTKMSPRSYRSGEEKRDYSSSRGSEPPPASPACIAAAADEEIFAELEKAGIPRQQAETFDLELARVALTWLCQRVTDRTLKPVRDRRRLLLKILHKPLFCGFYRDAHGWHPPPPEGQAKILENQRNKAIAQDTAKTVAQQTADRLRVERLMKECNETSEQEKIEAEWRALPDAEKEEIRRAVRKKMPGVFDHAPDRHTMFRHALLGEMQRRRLQTTAPPI